MATYSRSVRLYSKQPPVATIPYERPTANFTMIDNDFIDNAPLPPLSKWLYTVIVRHINWQVGEWSMSLQELAEDTGMSESAVKIHLKTLEAAGYVQIIRQYDRRRKQYHRNTYRLVRPAHPNATTSAHDDAVVASSAESGGLSDDPGVGQNLPQGVGHDVSSNKIPLQQDTPAPPPVTKYVSNPHLDCEGILSGEETAAQMPTEACASAALHNQVYKGKKSTRKSAQKSAYARAQTNSASQQKQTQAITETPAPPPVPPPPSSEPAARRPSKRAKLMTEDDLIDGYSHQPWYDFMWQLGLLCQLDWRFNIGQLSYWASRLYQAGYREEHLYRFERWWQRDYWRGRKLEKAPSIGTVVKLMKQAVGDPVQRGG